MISPEHYQQIFKVLPMLQQATAQAGTGMAAQFIHDFQQAATFVRIAAGRDIFVEGDRADAIALLVSGVVRVYKISETGREITLYRFGLGESCVLTANAILSRQAFPAIASVEQDAEAVLIPSDTFREWVRRYDLWRDFVFDLFAQRLLTVMTIVDEVAFRQMDRRVAALLLARAKTQNPIRITHQEIAAELGSSREVISRLIEDFASAGIVNTTRGLIQIVNFAQLEARS